MLRTDSVARARPAPLAIARPTLRPWTWFTAERRFYLYVILVQALLIATLLMAISSPKLLDTITTEKTVRGVDVEGVVDRLGGYLLFGGALMSGLVMLGTLRQRRRLDLFWFLYCGALLLAALEESDWLKQSGQSVVIFGHRYSALHDMLATGVKPFRAGAADYPFAATTVVLATAAVAAGVVMLVHWSVSRTRRPDFELLGLIGLGLFFVSLGALIDADLLPKPVAIDWKAHLEEPLETVGAVCLAVVSLEGLLRGGGRASPS